MSWSEQMTNDEKQDTENSIWTENAVLYEHKHKLLVQIEKRHMYNLNNEFTKLTF